MMKALPINTMIDGESHRIAAALQKINNALVAKNIPLLQAKHYAEQLEKMAAEFSALTEEKRERSFGVVADRSESSVGSGYEYGAGNSLSYRPISGNCNAVSPQMRYFLNESEHFVLGKVTFAAAYEGPPGLVHGGYIAACMDEMFGIAVSHSEIKEPCMTGTLKVIYRAPVPLLQEITYRSWVEKEEGRKVFAKCTVNDNHNNLCCEGEAIFLKIDPSVYAKMGG
jgi:acyl-coenzyme A thioesterase PaaI-like protein